MGKREVKERAKSQRRMRKRKRKKGEFETRGAKERCGAEENRRGE